MSLHLERLGQLGDDFAGELAGAARRGVPLHDCKFVAAQACHRIAAGDHALQPFGDRAQQRIADRVTQRIVDTLEPVEIEKHHRNAIAPAERLLHLVLEQDAIGQIGECVVPGIWMILASAWRRSVTSS